jgi:CIC family chloride channel protein
VRRFPLLLLIVAGAACGIIAVAFHALVDLLRGLLIANALHQHGAMRTALVIAIPSLVSLLIAVLMRRFAPFAAGANLARVRRAYDDDVKLLDHRSVLATLFFTPLSLGAGAPLGPEGPTVVIASGAAMAIARVARAPRRVVRRMIPVGTAAGIAAIFNTPITGVVFAMEEVMGAASRDLLGGTIVAAVAAAVVERLMLGGRPLLSAPVASWSDVRELFGFAAAGLAAGFVSGGSIHVISALRRFTSRISVPVRAAIGGAAVGVIGVFVPAMLSVGYETTGLFLHGGGNLRSAGAAFGAKAIGFVVAVGCGVVGGTFAPSLFIGSSLGATIGHAAAIALPHAHIDPGAYALVGMGAFFAGFLRCPISAVLIVFEVTGDYGLILPLMLAVAIATALSRRIAPHSLTELQMKEEGHVEPVAADDPLKGLTIDELMSRDIVVLPAEINMAEAARRTSGMRHRIYPVVNEEQRVIGVLPATSITGEEEPIAAHVKPPRVLANHNDDVVAVLRRMAHAGIDRCVVVDDDERIAGLLSPSDILRARLKAYGRAEG